MAITRRKFLVGSGLVGGGLILGISLSGGDGDIPGTVAGSFQPNAWLQITRDGRVIYQLHKSEMGQGVFTGLPLLLGEELDLDPATFEIAMAGVHPAFTAPPIGTQITGGSNSLSSSWDSLRHAGAAARAMLIAAAAAQWAVPVSACSTDNGEVINQQSGERLAYAQLAEAASDFTDQPYSLKAPEDYRWVGKAYPRLDAVSKSTGTARFGVDVELEGMKVAVIVRCPHFGGTVTQWSADRVTALPGVVAALEVHSGIAIVADGYWQARQAVTQLQVEWDKGPLAGLSSADMLALQQEALDSDEPHIVKEEGDISVLDAVNENAISVQYSIPTAHHSPMEPQNATALYTRSGGKPHCELWAPNQAPDICRALVAHFADVSPDNIRVNSTFMGGGFGRRGYPDYVGEVAAIAKQLPDVPVKLMWSREDDMQHDFYRPATLHRMEGAIDESGQLLAWKHRLVAPSIVRGFAVEIMGAMLPTWVPTKVARSLGRFMGNTMAAVDPSKADGAEIPYQVDNLSVGQIEYDPGIPVGFWRSVGFSYNVFVVESFLDELCHQAGEDPLDYRMRHLADDDRHRGVLELVAEKADWKDSGLIGTGRAQGIAVARPFFTYCAMVAEVSVSGNSFTVDRIVAAVDCGFVVTPDIVISQVESGIIYGLGAALKAPVTFEDGKTVQSNFHDLPVMRMHEIPKIEVHLVDSADSPTGIGEIGVPPVAPAIANALFSATGQRLRDMPLKLV